ncbi:helix-turn-helix transcriptional regulator [Undibacterium sp. Di26W]|uniref:helix-turn-helix transcriptional regulator n=1 Tax=Undibacterium sp. Di26W TaxID=3413035 RepID=UPI003BF05211
MGQPSRIYRITQMLHQAKVVTKADIIDELEISLATFKRYLSYLRDRMNIPVEFDKNAGGYRIAWGEPNSQQELPGIWFNADEIHALLTMQHLLNDLQPELLAGVKLRQRCELL